MAKTIEVRSGSLTEGSETVLVNASNTNVLLGSGVSGAIRRACGPGFQAELQEVLQRKKQGPMDPGDVLVTGAGSHPSAKWIIHVAVMDYRREVGPASAPTLDTLRTGAERVWDAVEVLPDVGPHTVAMVALGAGTGGLGLVPSTRVAAETLKAHWALRSPSRIEAVVFYGYHLHEYLAMAGELAKHFPEVLDALPAEARAFVEQG
jgi:O-acetyl-ADP-ribose deacetylase (regulator of RNase III)